MLAGLLFAVADTTDPPHRLVATLPFATGLLIEHQARQLIDAGASQILVLAGRADPALAGAIHRIGRGGMAVDLVLSAAEVAAKLHPLARLLVLADGLVAAGGAVAALAHDEGEALLVIPLADAPAGFERIGGAMAWAGVARLDPRRLDEVAGLPADYDPQSALLRVAEAAGVDRRLLSADAIRQGHGIEHDGDRLTMRAQRLATASVEPSGEWFDQYLATPLARWVLPMLVARTVSVGAVAAAVGGIALAAALALGGGLICWGLLLALAATLGTTIGRAFAMLREVPRLRSGFALARLVIPNGAALLLGVTIGVAGGDLAPSILALGLVIAATLTERASDEPRGWWGAPPAYLLVVSAGALLGRPLIGLAAAAGYAVITLAAAVEVLSRKA